MNKDFIPYRSITNLNKAGTAKVIQCNGNDPSIPWVAIEKLHGSNFQVRLTMENGKIKDLVCGSREGFLDPSNKFYGYKAVVERCKDHLEELANKINLAHLNIVGEFEIIFYGEIVGDKVQKEIRYHTETEYYLFDVTVLHNGTVYTIAPNELYSVFDELKSYDFDSVKIAPILMLGPFDDIVVSCPRTFISLVESQNDYPVQVDPSDDSFCIDKTNVAEGFILRPWKHNMFFRNRLHCSEMKSDKPVYGPEYELSHVQRMVLKVKPEIWLEVASTYKVTKGPYEEYKNLTEDEIELCEAIKPFLVENRASAVLSKKSVVYDSEFNNVLEDFVNDALSDIANIDLNSNIKTYSDISLLPKRVRRNITRYSSKIIRSKFLELAVPHPTSHF